MSRQDANTAFAVTSFLYGGNAAYIDDLYARYEIDPKWQGEIPVTLLIGSDGSIRRIEGSAKLPEVSTWLNQQQEPPPQVP